MNTFITISVDSELKARVDAASEEQGRSAFIREAVIEKLERMVQEDVANGG